MSKVFSVLSGTILCCAVAYILPFYVSVSNAWFALLLLLLMLEIDV